MRFWRKKRLTKEAHAKLIEIRGVLDTVDPNDFNWMLTPCCPLGIARKRGVIPAGGMDLRIDALNCLGGDPDLVDLIFFGRYRPIVFRKDLSRLNGEVGLNIAKHFLDKLIKRTKP